MKADTGTRDPFKYSGKVKVEIRNADGKVVAKTTGSKLIFEETKGGRKGKIIIPYNVLDLSKNSTHGFGGGQVWLTTGAKAEMTAIALMIRPPFYGYKWTSADIYVRIKVFRPDMLADPQNFVDAICDAVKVGIGQDDNVYKGSWTWELDKDNPRIEIEVEQLEEV